MAGPPPDDGRKVGNTYEDVAEYLKKWEEVHIMLSHLDSTGIKRYTREQHFNQQQQ